MLLMAVLYSLMFIRQEMRKLADSDDMLSLQTDSIFYWLGQKDQNTLKMLQEFVSSNDSMLTISEINEFVAEQAPPVIEKPVVQERVVTKRDSIVEAPTKKKGFFKRLGEVFVPPKDEKAVQVKTSTEVERDTVLHQYDVVDSLKRVVVQKAVVTRQKAKKEPSLQWRKDYYRKLNADLTAQIDIVIKGYENKALERIRHNTEAGLRIRREATKTIGWVATGAVSLSAIFLILIWRDISRSNRYRRELEKAKRRTEKLLVTREKLMLAITHDFKAPLGSILGYTELLSDQVSDKQQLAYLGNMKTSSEHLLKLVGDLLEFHRLDLNKSKANNTSFYPSELFGEIRACFEPLAGNKGLKLRYHIAPELQGSFSGDPLHIRQLTDNLISNAIKFTKEGEVLLDVSYASSKLRIEVTDTGQGMTPSDQKRIFQEFTRLPGAQGVEGFGLGLSIVKKLIRLLDGDIDVQSSPGKGSSFVVKLPLTKLADRDNDERTPVWESAPVAQETPAVPEDIQKVAPVVPQDVPAIPEETPIAQEATPTVQETTPVAQEEVPAIPKVAPVIPEVASYAQELSSVIQEDVPEAQENLLFAQEPVSIEPVVKKLRILLIDDDKIQLQLTSAMLRQQDIIAVCCDHPDELFERLREDEYDLLLTDVQMPAMSGFELLKVLRASNIKQAQTIPVVAVTARSAVNDGEFVSHGFVGCLHKPFTKKDLRRVINKLADNFNFDALLVFSDGDLLASRAFINSFASETVKNIAQMREAYIASDTEGIAAMAHKMLPSLTMIESNRTVPLLMWLEMQRGKDFSDEIKHRTEEALSALLIIVDEAKTYVAQMLK